MESAADLRVLGGIPWEPTDSLPRKPLDELVRLYERSALAALLLTINRGFVEDTEILTEAGDALIKQAPGNPVALARLSQASVSAGAGYTSHELQVRDGLTRYPNNLLLNLSQVYIHRTRKQYAEAVTAGLQAARCAPENPMVWLSLARTYYDDSDEVRKGRLADQLSQEEMEMLQARYEQSLKAAQRAVELDPQFGSGWLGLSNAARFAGDADLADTALWKAVEKDPDEPAGYKWGLQLYHPKWQADAIKAARIAKLAVRAASRVGPEWTPATRVEVAFHAAVVGHPSAAQSIARTPEQWQSVQNLLANTPEMILRGQ